MAMYEPAIYITGYKRHLSLERLLNSLNKAVYPNKVNLIISLDGGHTEEVSRCADSFQFKGGQKTVVKHHKNLGLRKHILWCGDKVLTHESIILLEDDLVVAPLFYIFAKQCLSFYHGKTFVAGISLYAQAYNEYTNTPFSPLEIEYDQYFMQVPSSWGQAWSRDQWVDFRKWYENNSDSRSIKDITNLPNTVKKWPESSWKKYFSAYISQSNKFFIYPYRSLTSNCADTGGFHSVSGLKVLQVPLYSNSNINHQFKLADRIEQSANYDAFMEPICDFLFDGKLIAKSDLHIDFHNIKPIELLKERRYAITPKSSEGKLIEIPLQFKPVEINFQYYRQTEEVLACHLIETKNIRTLTRIRNYKYNFMLIQYYESYIPGIKKSLYFVALKIIERFAPDFFKNL
jgi:hypothetical protein